MGRNLRALAVLSLGLMLGVGACVLNPQPEPPDNPDGGHSYATGGSGGGIGFTPGGGAAGTLNGGGGFGGQAKLDAGPVPNTEAGTTADGAIGDGSADRDGAAGDGSAIDGAAGDGAVGDAAPNDGVAPGDAD